MSWIRTYVTICAGILGLVVVALILLVSIADLGMSVHGVVALFAGSLLTVALAMVLMGLVFLSNRAGHDASSHSAAGEMDSDDERPSSK